MIRQAISCDVCGAEKQHTNHWFVAYSHGAELRVSGWIAGKRLRAGAKHLCGQTCLHKLVDEFLARTVSASAQTVPNVDRASAALTTAPRGNFESMPEPHLDFDEFESSARLIPTPDLLAFATRYWHAEAWKRERERTQRSDARTAARAPHQRNIA